MHDKPPDPAGRRAPPSMERPLTDLARHLRIDTAGDGAPHSDREWAERLRDADPGDIAQYLASGRALQQETAMQLGLLHGVLDGTPDGMLVVDLDGRVMLANENFLRMWRIPPDLAASHDDATLLAFVVAQLRDPEAFIDRVRELYATPEASTDAEDIAFHDGRVFVRRSCPVLVNDAPVGRVWVFHDATAAREAARQKRLLEAQLRHSQKMEAIGQLAGGVAHDFNNLLTVINGYARLLEDSTPAHDPRHAKIAEIRRAGERATTLTRQLLAFGRKQILEPKVLDLPETLGEMQLMLRRLIGEDIEMQWIAGPDVPRVLADPGQVEQILMNLVVNSRDAMPRGGTLTLEVTHATLARGDFPAYAGMTPGSYAAITVSDTGHGIPEAVQAHIFEPFFTTKELGRGTGLGLATVYGIVQQSGGHITFTSTLGTGTIFRVYLPAAANAERRVNPAHFRPAVPGGDETILLVEDEREVRELAREVLESHGYHVLCCASPEDAITECRAHPGPLDLMITDVVMPGMNGLELRRRMADARPGMRVLYMSGYADRAAALGAAGDAEVAFLQKPFHPAALLAKVRRALGDLPRAA